MNNYNYDWYRNNTNQMFFNGMNYNQPVNNMNQNMNYNQPMNNQMNMNQGYSQQPMNQYPNNNM